MRLRPPWTFLAAFSIAGFLLRAATAIVWPTIHRPDETFQNLEPAYRLLTGWGIVTWEWRDGIRSWLFPDCLYAIMRVARLLHLPLLPSIATVLSVVAAAGVCIAVLVGWRRYGSAGAVLCGALAAVWPDLVYFSPKPLVEIQSGNLLVVAAGLASLDDRRPPWRVAAIGLLLGLAFDLRFQLAPALAVVAIGAARANLRRGWLPLLAGAAIPLALLGVIDLATWGSPFQSIWKNIEINFVHDRSSVYGVEPLDWYATGLVGRYGVASILLALCFGLGFRAAPIPAMAAVVVVAFHSLIAHKEVSFIYAALPCGLIVAGLGATRLLVALAAGLAAAPLAVAAAVLLCGLTFALAPQAATPFDDATARPHIRALWSIVRTRPDLCGLALYGDRTFPWGGTPGYVELERAVPIYLLHDAQALARSAPGFNYLLVDTGAVPEIPTGDRLACDGKFCLIHRDHSCRPVDGFDINTVLRETDE